MNDCKFAILGGGISGLSAAYHLQNFSSDYRLFEGTDHYGGLCSGFEVDGYWFDRFIHLSFTNHEYIKDIFHKDLEVIKHTPSPINYYHGKWIDHPAQNNLISLDIEERIKIIEDFIKKDLLEIDYKLNYENWLRAQFGDYFAEKFPMVYTRKYWLTKAKQLETSWVGERIYKPDLSEILRGAMTNQIPNKYYAKEMRYPQKGRYISFLENIINHVKNKEVNKKVVEIDLNKKIIVFEDGDKCKYERLISTIPLTMMINLIVDPPPDVKAHSEKLHCTSGYTISLGLKEPLDKKNLWTYIYDEDILPARINYPYLKSEKNAPNGTGSLQAEYYSLKHSKVSEDSLIDTVIANLVKIGMISTNDITTTHLNFEEFANVVFDHDILKSRKIIHNYLEDSNVVSAGRFGMWEYYWSDQSFMSGKSASEKILN